MPGHTDIAGNEITDSLAKEATKLDPLENEISFAVLGVTTHVKVTLALRLGDEGIAQRS